MHTPLMPKATAVWLIENTSLSFRQIGAFCNLHALEIQAIADAEHNKIVGFDPIVSGQITAEEIKRCEEDEQLDLTLLVPVTADKILGKKKSKYTPLSKRGDRPDAIAWLLKFHPEIKDSSICSLVNTTKATVEAVRSKNHWNSENIKVQSPVSLGLCTQEELDNILNK